MANIYNNEILKFSEKSTDKNNEVRHTKNMVLTITEAANYLRISRGSLYRLINRNLIMTFCIGRRRFITANAIDNYLSSVEEYRYV